MTFKIQIELWVGLCINFISELVIQALTQNPKSKIRFWILFFRNPKSDFGFQGDHAFQKVLLHCNTPGEAVEAAQRPKNEVCQILLKIVLNERYIILLHVTMIFFINFMIIRCLFITFPKSSKFCFL